MYDIESQQWTFITEDTASMGGPKLIFDHQMVIDIECQTIYVFGGRVLVRYFCLLLLPKVINLLLYFVAVAGLLIAYSEVLTDKEKISTVKELSSLI